MTLSRLTSKGEGVLVDLQTKRYYQLSPTAMLIWKSLEKQMDPAKIVARLTAEYDVSEEHARASVARTLNQLEVRRLVIRSEG
jgi:hypothetical protein